MPHPSISVALCTYNGAEYLDAQLRSIAEQTLLPAEIVISDDGSTDGTAAVVEAFASATALPVRFIRQPVNLGVTQNFSAALALCQSELIALCDQDDVWLPDKLAAYSDFFSVHPDCLAVFSDATVVDDALRPLAARASLWERAGLTGDVLAQIADPKTSLKPLISDFYVTGATLIVRRELLRYALPIPERLPARMIHDGWLAAVAATLGKLNFLPRSTILYRQHPKQQVGLDRGSPRHQSLRAAYAKLAGVADDGEKLYAALSARFAGEARPALLEEIQARAAHFRLRAALPKSRWHRLGPVAYEWRRDGYRRYCRRPLFAALRDLIV